MLLLRAGLQEQHKPSEGEAIEGLQNPPNALQKEARHKAVYVQKMWENICSERWLEDSREELWEVVVLHLWLRLQAQKITEGPYQVLWEGTQPSPSLPSFWGWEGMHHCLWWRWCQCSSSSSSSSSCMIWLTLLQKSCREINVIERVWWVRTLVLSNKKFSTMAETWRLRERFVTEHLQGGDEVLYE